MISGAIVALAATAQASAGVFPAAPLPPRVVASGGAVVVTGDIDAVHLNPANAVLTRGLDLSFLSYPRTGLEGFSAVFSAGGRVGVILALWSYRLTDIFDDDLVAVDPSLAELGASSVGGSLGFTILAGPLGFGMLATGRRQSIVGSQASGQTLSFGGRAQAKVLEFGVSQTDLPWGSPNRAVAPEPATLIGVATRVSRFGVEARLEVDARVPRWEFSRVSYGAASRVGFPPLDVTVGYRAEQGWSAGAALALQRWRLAVGGTLVSTGRLDHRVAVGLSYR